MPDAVLERTKNVVLLPVSVAPREETDGFGIGDHLGMTRGEGVCTGLV